LGWGKTVVSLLIVAVAVGAVGYVVGRFVTPPEQTVTTTTTTETKTTTTISTTASVTTSTQASTTRVTVTETSTTTSTVNRDLPPTFPAPANSSAVIHGFYLLEGRVLATLSVDRPVYSQGETVHFKATLTNLTPDYLALNLDFYAFYIEDNRTHHLVWTYPEFMYGAGFGPGLPTFRLFLAPNETKTEGQWSGADWNMRGLHLAENGWPVYYDDHFVPEGPYRLRWDASIHYKDESDFTSLQTVPFTITNPK
jgi:hypothetical protein